MLKNRYYVEALITRWLYLLFNFKTNKLMKTKFFYIFILSIFLSISVFAQEADETTTGDDAADFEIPDVEHITEGIGGNLNFANIGDQFFVGARFKPELSFGKLGFGLDIPLMVNIQTGELRIDEFKDGVGPLRIIRFVRWGVKKRDPFYIRVGELSDAQLGFGMMISDYNNSISFEKRKLGMEFDLVVQKKFGLEFLYSDLNLTSFNLMGIRPYYKPFGATGIPIVKTFEIGVGYVTDYDKTILTQTDSTIYRANYLLDKGINSFAADMGFYIFNWNWLRWSVYAQAGYMPKIKSDSLQRYIDASPDEHIKNYTDGMGWSIGSDFKFKFFGNLLKVNYRAERFWHSDYYIPRFYSFAYELNKDEHILGLVNTHAEQGMYFKLGASVLDKVILHTNIIFDDQINEDHPAEMYFGLDLSNVVDKLTLYTSLYKADITNFSDILTLDENALFESLIAWRIYEVPVIKLQFTAGVDFKWTYAFLANQDFEATHYVSPFFSVNIPLNKEEETSKDKE